VPEASSIPLPADQEPSAAGLLQYRPFRMLCYTRFLSRLAQYSVNYALVLLIVDETGLALMSSLLVLALVVPQTVAGIAAGAAADVFPKRMLIVFGDGLRAAICVLFVLQGGDVVSYFVVALALSAFTPFATNAEGAIQPQIIERPDRARANAISQAVGQGAQLAGLGVLTPFALRLLDNTDVLFIISAGLYVGAAIAGVLIGAHHRAAVQEVGGSPVGRWWTVGWHTMRGDSLVWNAAMELTLISTTLIILSGLIPTYIEDVLDIPVDVGAVVLLPAVVGVVAGLRIAGFLAHRVPHALLSSVGFTGFVLSLAALTFVNEEADFLSGFGLFGWLDRVNIGSFDGGGVVAMMVMLPLGFSFAIVSVAAQTVLNDRVPLQLQGRVGSTQAAMAAIVACLPVLFAGAIADLIGVVPVMAVVAALIGAAAVANLRDRRRGARRSPAVIG